VPVATRRDWGQAMPRQLLPPFRPDESQALVDATAGNLSRDDAQAFSQQWILTDAFNSELGVQLASAQARRPIMHIKTIALAVVLLIVVVGVWDSACLHFLFPKAPTNTSHLQAVTEFYGSPAVMSIAAVPSSSSHMQKVLFVGNSFSYVHGGIWSQYKVIAEACVPGLKVQTEHNAVGCRTLAMAAGDSAAEMVRAQAYDILVLQDQSDLMDYRGGIRSIKGFFAPEANKRGATVGFYQTWAKPGWGNFTADTLTRKYAYQRFARVAETAGAKTLMARVGEAFLGVLNNLGGDTEDPSFTKLYDGDLEHPSTLGLNLAAWVMAYAFNSKQMPVGGCNAANVPSVQGQSDIQKRQFAAIACDLAGACSMSPANDERKKPLCKRAAAMQGNWLRRMTREAAHGDQKLGDARPADCLFTEHWHVDGTRVTATVEGKAAQHNLRVRDYGSFCSVKLVPELIYVKQEEENRIVFNDCRVWRRAVGGSTHPPSDECECMTTATWKDQDGDNCQVYAPGGKKHSEAACDAGLGGIVSRTQSLQAWQVCPGCGRCTLATHTVR